ncbi:MAG: 50S ribosomal protein L21 [bacterium]|nr:50S ribosomal protein L21 [bacterium]
MRYAIVSISGKQYKVEEGKALLVSRQDTEVGKKVKFDKVLLLRDEDKVEVGQPEVSGASVEATVTAHPLGPKIVVAKYKAKSRYRRKRGHRSFYTELKVEKISVK